MANVVLAQFESYWIWFGNFVAINCVFLFVCLCVDVCCTHSATESSAILSKSLACIESPLLVLELIAVALVRALLSAGVCVIEFGVCQVSPGVVAS